MAIQTKNHRGEAAMKMLTCVIALALAGCASGPVAPSWQLDSRSALEGFTDAYLKGDSSAARSEFARARSETAATGDPVAVAQVELVRCAAQTASLDIDACSGFTALAGDATADAAGVRGLSCRPLDRPECGAAAGSATRRAIGEDCRSAVTPGGCRRRAARRQRSRRKVWQRPPTPHRNRAGAGRCWRGWVYRFSAQRRWATTPK